MKYLTKNSRVLFLSLLSLSLLISFLKIDFWPRNIEDGDSWGYYSYLPSAFIHHDLGSLERTISTTKKYGNFSDHFADQYGLYRKHPETGKILVKYTNGVAVMLSPAFLVGHIYALLSHHEADGFSSPYRFALGLGVIFWVCLGLYYLIGVLRRYFEKEVTALTVIGILFATNLFYNTVHNSIMSHALLFSLYCLLIYFTDSYYKQPSFRRLLGLALLSAFIILVRMNEIYCLLIPILWGVSSRATLFERIKFFQQHYGQILICGAASLVVFIPQFLYWKTYAGTWIYNGYIGETFDFSDPHIYEGWFGFNNGWLTWSPIMIFAVLGIFALWKYARPAFWATLILLPLHSYIIYSWWCWYYINGFGSRPMEHMYPLLAFSLASIFTLFYTHKIGKLLVLALVFLTSSLNIFQNFQVAWGLLITNSNHAYYMEMLGQTKSNHNILVAKSSNELQPTNPSRVELIFDRDFEKSDYLGNINSEVAYSGKSSLKLSKQHILLDTLPSEILSKGDYVKMSVKTYFTDQEPRFPNLWDTPFFYIQWQDANNEKIKESGIYPFQFADNPTYSIYFTGNPNVWSDTYFYVKIPKDAHHGILGIWNGKETAFYMDDLRLELYQK